MSADGECVYVNAAWQELTGRTCQQELRSGWAQGLHEQDLERCLTALRRACESCLPCTIEYRLRRTDGAYTRIHEQAIPAFNDRGQFLGLFSLCADRGKESELVQEVEHARHRVRELESALDRSRNEAEEFASVASHDLKEPLRGIHNYVSFVLEDAGHTLDAESVSRLQVVRHLSQRAESLLNGMLRVAQVGRSELRLKTVDLEALVRQVVGTLKPSLEAHRARVELAGGLGLVRCDPCGIAEVLSNLVLNAAKFNDHDERVVIISAEPDSSRARLVVMIEDNGIGIPERHRELVFRMFKRLHRRDQYGGGIGAGLTIARRIVERHGGTMWMEPSESGGTRACFTLGRVEGLVNGGNEVSHPHR